MNEAIDEIRFAKQNGAVGIFFRGIEGDYTLDNPYLFPVYEEAQKQNLSICVHTGCGVRAILEMFELSRESHLRSYAGHAAARFPRSHRQ